jgi:hypothetical protein
VPPNILKHRPGKIFHAAFGFMIFALLLSPIFFAQTQPAPVPIDAATQQAEREGCIKNLKLIYDAIQAYEVDHKDIPNWLSDLVPQYLSDANVLICPVCKRTGEAETSALADPNLPCSYLYEFCPLPLSKPFAEDGITRREWKRRQMGLVGSIVPIVRCRHHLPLLNLAFDGKIYDSPNSWEDTVSNRMDVTLLSAEHLFPPDAKTNAPAKKTPPKLKFAKRDAKATTNEINLVKYYNAMLTQSWHGGTNNDLASLPTGLQKLAGVEFDIRGIVQLGSKSSSTKKFPAEVKNIPINQKCQRLNFLHASTMGIMADEGKMIGSYIVHYATNRMRADIPIIYGEDVRDWHVLPKEKSLTNQLAVAWTGTNAVSNTSIRSIRLFKTTWINIAPDLEIESVDYISAMGNAAPFLVAITTE